MHGSISRLVFHLQLKESILIDQLTRIISDNYIFYEYMYNLVCRSY